MNECPIKIDENQIAIEKHTILSVFIGISDLHYLKKQKKKIQIKTQTIFKKLSQYGFINTLIKIK